MTEIRNYPVFVGVDPVHSGDIIAGANKEPVPADPANSSEALAGTTDYNTVAIPNAGANDNETV